MEIKNSPFFSQAKLMLQSLPHVLEEKSFALKGGTAINFFFQNMPRLSVDIDLTYLPIESREASLRNIERALQRIAQNIQRYLPDVKVQEVKVKSPDMISKLIISNTEAQIKVEPNLVIRGVAFPITTEFALSPKAQETFEMFIEARIVSFADVFGGKICAALDRQHPRDFYDVKFLLDNEGITEMVHKGFLVYLISHPRPIHELLNPIMKEFRSVYEAEFQGMAAEDVSYDELVRVRGALVDLIKQALTQDEKDFLVSFKKGEPEWNLLGLESVKDLPAVQWKLINIRKMDEAKREDFVQKLRNALN